MQNPVGFFDSGKGGLCILEAFRRLCPDESTVYIADSAYCPYGNRPMHEIVERADANTRTLLDRYGCKMIVVACNTATAAAIDFLRARHPGVPFVGLEPAVKPAAMESRSGVVAVLATAGTFSGRLYNETKAKFAQDVTVIATVADEFVSLVEDDLSESPQAETAVRRRLEPLLAAGADRIVLGCTHFPRLKRAMEKVCAGRASIVDPSDAVARQARRLLAERGLAAQRDAAGHSADIRLTTAPTRRTVLVTGGTTRLGKAIADRLHDCGWRVLRSSHRADSGADIICDLSLPGAADTLFAEAGKLLGDAPQAVVNNAAVYLADEGTTTAVNLVAPRRIAELMAAQSFGGCVVNILDAAIFRAAPETRPQFKCYADTKKRLYEATVADAERWRDILRINAVAPGSVLAPVGIREKAVLPASGKRPAPSDVAAAVEKLLSSKTATGQTIQV